LFYHIAKQFGIEKRHITSNNETVWGAGGQQARIYTTKWALVWVNVCHDFGITCEREVKVLLGSHYQNLAGLRFESFDYMLDKAYVADSRQSFIPAKPPIFPTG